MSGEEDPPKQRRRSRTSRAVHAATDPVKEHVVDPVVEHVVDHVVEPVHDRVVEPVVDHVVEPVVDHVVEPVVDHVVHPVASAVGRVLGAAGTAWAGRDAVIARRLRRQAREPLANLFELYPEARDATRVEIGIRFVPLEEIAGTAVAGAAQRGGDFLPLPPFRSDNWQGRWQRIRRANERLVALPPVDLVKYADAYWVEDGHNRVAAALYAGGAGVDAAVTELVPLDARRTETPNALLPLLADTSGLRTAVFEATTAREDEGATAEPAEPERVAKGIDGSRPQPAEPAAVRTAGTPRVDGTGLDTAGVDETVAAPDVEGRR